VSFNGMFAVSREHIKQHPVSHYEALLRALSHSSNPEDGHFLERSWVAVFHPLPRECLYDERQLYPVWHATRRVYSEMEVYIMWTRHSLLGGNEEVSGWVKVALALFLLLVLRVMCSR
jgi:hypothetical protein